MNTKTAKRILLDEWHMQVFIRPAGKLTKDEKRVIRTLMESYLRIVASRITNEMGGKIEVRLSQ